ncbi:MAG: putative DNA binding domain-containing protein [Gomphosphaeria aponina SAG 52.96 = DSM 107014]|uniref:DNA binding domain-containing protein n=1 Tax=Gomphosphaeria aponina SAG 52.96 = DSM 107014 TaxID=1521640 RepID=A0A941GX28_9CHRO|nr:putative DNA binding domain-containing protein [Gomphosphaeria aponina SAG 52.96 = DSM 107014]
MSIDRILDLIKSGENSRVEFKSGEFRNESLAKEIVAFANMKGGTILVGIEDNGEISGVKNVHLLMEKIISICRNNIQPSLIPELISISYEDKFILMIEIEKGICKPYKVKSLNRYYIRAGSVSIEPTQEELIRLLQEGGQFHFEVSSMPRTGIMDLDPLKLHYYCREIRGISEHENNSRTWYNLQILDQEERLTIAGSLFFSRQIGRMLPQAGIELNAFAGNDVTSPLIDSLALTETIPEAIQAGESFVKRNSRHLPVFNEEETRRHDIPDYEPFVIRELLVNAFAHRDWSIFGQSIRLLLFNDRLELFSPGSLPNTLNLDRALAGISYYRNPLIAQMLKDYGLMDHLGRGLLKIIKFYHSNHLATPIFENTDTFFRAIVYKP